MNVWKSTDNIFDLSGPSPVLLKDGYNAAKVSKTREELKQHFGSDLYDKVSSIMATEINRYNAPVSQNMVDVYHQSFLHSNPQKSFHDFINDTSLCHLRQNNINIFSPLQDYEYHFTKNIYAPLHQYEGPVFKGGASDLVGKLSEVYNHLKLRKTEENTCFHVDVRLATQSCSFVTTNSTQINQSDDNEDDDDDDDDDDDSKYAQKVLEYEQHIESEQNLPSKDDDDEYTKNVESKHNFPSKAPLSKTNNFQQSNISKYAKMETNDLARTNIDNVMRSTMPPLSREPYSYKRYEMLFNMETNQVTTFEAVSNNKLPSCSFRDSPLCRISNSTESTQEILNYLNPTKAVMNLLTFSYHLLNDCIQIYMHLTSDGNSYGTRIFKEDLFSTIPALFECKTINKFAREELDTYLEFIDDTMYEEYKKVLFKRNADDLPQELSDKMRSHLEQFVYSWNNRNGALIWIDLEEITRIFTKKQINYAYFKNLHRCKFIELLERNGINTCIANELWLNFGGLLQDNSDCKSCMDERSENKSVSTNSTDSSALDNYLKANNPYFDAASHQNGNNMIQHSSSSDNNSVYNLNIAPYPNGNGNVQCSIGLVPFSQNRIDESDNLNFQLSAEPVLMGDVSSCSDDEDSEYSINDNDRDYVLHENNGDNDKDYNYESTPCSVYVGDQASDTDTDQMDIKQNDDNKYQNVPYISQDEEKMLHENGNQPSDTDNDEQEEQQDVDDSDDDDGDIYDDEPSYVMPVRQEFNKWEMINNPFDAGDRYYHTSIIPATRSKLEKIVSANEEILNQTHIEQQAQILITIFQNTWKLYCCVMISAHIMMKWLDNMKKIQYDIVVVDDDDENNK